MKINITPIAVATIVPASLAAVAASLVLPFTQPAQAMASAPVAAHHVAAKPAHAAAATHAAKTHVDVRTRRHHHARHEQASANLAASSQSGQSQQAQAQTQTAQSSQTSTGLPTGMSAFEQCVAWRESSNTPTDPDGLFGILPSTWAQLGYSGTAGQYSVAVQQQAFDKLYAEYGTQPWAPSDGC